MLRQRKEAYDAIRPLFQAAEQSNDRAGADAAACIAEMLRASEKLRAGSATNLPLTIGTEMLDKLVLALNANVSARRLFLEAHEMTPQVLKELGLERMFGDGIPCPPTQRAQSADIVPLTVAA